MAIQLASCAKVTRISSSCATKFYTSRFSPGVAPLFEQSRALPHKFRSRSLKFALPHGIAHDRQVSHFESKRLLTEKKISNCLSMIESYHKDTGYREPNKSMKYQLPNNSCLAPDWPAIFLLPSCIVCIPTISRSLHQIEMHIFRRR